MLSGAKQQEMQKRKVDNYISENRKRCRYSAIWILSGVGHRRYQSLGNALGAVVLVIVGVYLLFSGLIPAILRKLSGNKYYLYKKERTLWVTIWRFV